MLEGSIKDLQAENPTVEVDYHAAETNVTVDKLLVTVFTHAIENAMVHNDTENPRVTIESSLHNGIVHVTIADNGPGISEHELPFCLKGWNHY